MKTLLILFLFFSNYYLSYTSALPNDSDEKGLATNMSKLSISEINREQFIQNIINKSYDRDLVTRFIRAFPSQKKLSYETGISASTISKLKAPELYGDLEPSAKRFWKWLQSKDIVTLKKELDLSDQALQRIEKSLKLLNLSNSDIVYEQLGKDISIGSSSINTRPHLISDVIEYLKRMRGTFTHLNLANNLISDEGVEVLINELKTHELLEELNLSDNKISNKGLADLSILVKELRKLRCLNISKNYGPSQEILEIINSAMVEAHKENLKLIK